MELRSTVAHSLLALGLGARENDNMATHLASKLDGQVTQTTNTHNGNTIGGTDAILSQNSPDSSTSTHERGSIFRGKLIGDGVDASSIPDRTVAEGAVVGVMEAVLLLVTAILVPTC